MQRLFLIVIPGLLCIFGLGAYSAGIYFESELTAEREFSAQAIQELESVRNEIVQIKIVDNLETTLGSLVKLINTDVLDRKTAHDQIRDLVVPRLEALNNLPQDDLDIDMQMRIDELRVAAENFLIDAAEFNSVSLDQ